MMDEGEKKGKQSKLDDFEGSATAAPPQAPEAPPDDAKSPQPPRRPLDLGKLTLPRTKYKLIVSFYPYKTIKSTIRMAQGTYQVRISDLLSDAPPEVVSALLRILVSKVNRRPVPKDVDELYQDYVQSPQMLQRLGGVRQARGRKDMDGPAGARHDLIPVFERLNKAYFGGALDMPRLGWSKRTTTALFGHYDKDHRSITISRTLDSDDVPSFVLDYVLFHEMLHLLYDVKYKNRRRCVHGPEFKRHEGIFPRFEEAKGWLKKIHRRGHQGLRRVRKRRKQRVRRDV